MLSISELLKHTAVRVSIVIVILIALGSLTYYLIESAPPKVAYATATTGDISDDITAIGVVSPIQNPVLTFEVGGQVRSVSATVGQAVPQGTLLASLDTSVLAANLEAAQAKLNELESGPRGVDVAGQQTAVTSAQQSLTNAYANYPTTLQSTFARAQEAVNADADSLFDFSTKSNPALTFSTNNSGTKITADTEREALTPLFQTWQASLAAATSSPSQAQLENLTDQSIANLTQVQAFLTDLITAINDAQTGSSFAQTQQTAAFTQAHAALDTVNGLITSLNSARQSLTSEQLATQSAQDQLNQTLAGATPQDIQAQQAAVASIEAQIAQEEIIAPFAGTVASVSIKAGDVVAASTPAVTLIPNGTFEVDVFVPENDLPAIAVGAPTDVTLDAYGTGRLFPATVASVDSSPTTQSDGTQGYKVKLIFTNADPAIANGMHANVTIHAGSAQGVLLVPKSAVITEGAQSYVLKETPQGPVNTPVTIGLSNTASVEVLSGLVAGDRVSAVGAQ